LLRVFPLPLTRMQASDKFASACFIPLNSSVLPRGGAILIAINKKRQRSAILSKLLTWLGGAVLAVVLSAVAFVIIAAQYGWEFDAVLSGSMGPRIGVGGLVVIKPIDTQTLSVGNVISFKLPSIDTPICHRVIDVRNTADGRVFQTKGDANKAPDQNLVPASAVKGKEILYIPYIGRLAKLTQLGRERVTILGKRLPMAVVVIFPLGVAFIGLVLKDALEETFRPMQTRRKAVLKKRRERILKRRKAFL
jgi:signal peptidase